MKLIDVSNASLTKIYDCLGPRATANFARTNYRFSQLAKKENLPSNKIKCECVSMIHNIERNSIYVLCPIGFNREIPDVYKTVPIQGSLMTTMKNVMQSCIKYCSFPRFEFISFAVTEKYLANIRENLEPCLKSGVLEQLTFENCQMECSAKEFFETLGYLKIKRLDMYQVVLNQIRINNSNMSTLPLEIRILPSHREHCDVNDQMLTNLFYETNKIINIRYLKTQITLRAVLLFIEKMVTKMNKSSMKFKHELSVGEIKADSYSRYQLLLAQRIPQLTWEARELYIYTNEPHIIEYRVTHDKHDFEIRFIVPTREYSKITKHQTRTRIDNLRAKIQQNRQENDVYDHKEDREFIVENEQLWGSCYDEWTEIRIEMYRIQDPPQHDDDNNEDDDNDDDDNDDDDNDDDDNDDNDNQD